MGDNQPNFTYSLNRAGKVMHQLDTIIDFIRYGVTQAEKYNLFYGHGCDNAWDDILALVLDSLYIPQASAQHVLAAKLTDEEKQMIAHRISRRTEDHVPVPYLTQLAHFAGLSFYVDERVLIPRSPVAELIANQFQPWIEANRVDSILDLCTGSACIAIACAYAFPDADVDASELSSDALAVASINQARHQCQHRVNLIQSDLFQSIQPKEYDIIISNPPYVGASEMQSLPQEYRHEPTMALEAQDNGLAIVDVILRQAAQFLTEQGILVLEVGNSQHALVEKYPEVPFLWLEFEHGGSGVFLLTQTQLLEYF